MTEIGDLLAEKAAGGWLGISEKACRGALLVAGKSARV